MSKSDSNPVSTVKPIQFDVEGVQCNERGGLCFNLTCALNGKCCDFVSRNKYFRLKNEEYQKAYSDLLKENQELKESIEFWKKAYNGEEAQSAQLREGLVKSIKENQELKARVKDFEFAASINHDAYEKQKALNAELLSVLELVAKDFEQWPCKESTWNKVESAINKAKS